MTNIVRSRRGKKRGFKIFIIILLVLFVALNYFKFQPFHTFGFKVSESVLNTKNVILKPFNNFFSYFAFKKSQENNIEELEKDISNLKIEVLSNEILKYEYKNLLKQVAQGEESVEIAKVLLKPPFSSFSSLVISGDFDESKIGQKVYYRNIILGEIAEESSTTAVVKLYSSSGTTVPAKLKDGTQFEIHGRGTGQYEIILPKDVDVKEGDPIIYPENEIVLFGVVNKVFATEDDLFNKVLFNIPVDFADINFVRINKPLDILE